MVNRTIDREGVKKSQNSVAWGGTKINSRYDVGERSMFAPTDSPKGVKLLIIPYTVSIPNHPDGIAEGNLWYRMPYGVHRDVGNSGQSFLCVNRYDQSSCYVCDQRSAMYRAAKTEAAKNEAKKLWPQDRILMNVLDLDNQDKGIQIWDVAKNCFLSAFESAIQRVNGDYDCFYDPDNPFNVEIFFKKKNGEGFTFFEVGHVNFYPDEPMPDEFLEDAMVLDSCLKFPDNNNALAAAYNTPQINTQYDDEEDVEQPPRSGRYGTHQQQSAYGRTTTQPQGASQAPRQTAYPSGGGRAAQSYGAGNSAARVPARQVQNTRNVEGALVSPPRQAEYADEIHTEEPPRSRKAPNRVVEEDIPFDVGVSETAANENKCPSGFQFGVDFEQKGECEGCPAWEDCAEAADKLGGM